LSSLSADDFELLRPHLRAADLSQDTVLVEVDEALKRAYLPHKGVISLVVKLARGEHVQIAMIGRDSIFGAFSALGDSSRPSPRTARSSTGRTGGRSRAARRC
jgi:CRP-like cAMP-binding protein